MALTLVQAKEISPPPGKPPHLASRHQPRSTAAAACEFIDWYRAAGNRDVFDVLKWLPRRKPNSTPKSVSKSLALYIMVAWRIMFLMRLGRTCPNSRLIWCLTHWNGKSRTGSVKSAT
ncbi:MAG: hypothetical protein R3E93_04525 [Thiothrix sp.]